MKTDGRRVHLIERAAVRLDGASGLTAPASVASFPDPARAPDGVSVGVEPRRDWVTKSRPIIEREALERAGAVDWDGSSSRVAEEFRIVYAEVLRKSLGADREISAPRSKLVMITSALSGEGKSFTAINLAVGIARHNDHRILLIDAERRPGSLSDRLGVATAPGLLDLAADRDLDPAECVFASCEPNLDFLPCGSGSAEEAESLGASSTADVVESLARGYPDRLVLIDAPACLSSSRPHLFAPLVGHSVLVVAAGSTQEGDIEAALGLIRGCPSVSLLLNKVSRWQAHSFGSYAYSS
jgi:Mrp family chromosome partitioning ATPase